MFTQWCASGTRFRMGPGGRHIGVIPVGTILYIQDGICPLGGSRVEIVRRAPWIVEAWLNREYYPLIPGRPRTVYIRGGHLAVVRCLRTGRRQTVADWILLWCVDADLEYHWKGRRHESKSQDRKRVSLRPSPLGHRRPALRQAAAGRPTARRQSAGLPASRHDAHVPRPVRGDGSVCGPGVHQFAAL